MYKRMYEESVKGYDIKESITFANNRGFALGENSHAVQQFVTWQFTVENGKRDYYWGHYFSSERKAVRDFAYRYSLFQLDHGIVVVSSFPEMPHFSYFSTRPQDIGTLPKTENGPLSILNFSKRQYVEDGAFMAYGIATYSAPLSEKQISDYKLRPSKFNSQQKLSSFGQESPSKPNRSAPEINR